MPLRPTNGLKLRGALVGCQQRAPNFLSKYFRDASHTITYMNFGSASQAGRMTYVGIPESRRDEGGRASEWPGRTFSTPQNRAAAVRLGRNEAMISNMR